MAKPKASSKPKTANPPRRKLESRVLDGLPASAERLRVPGFGFTPLDDDLFALGYPHIALLHEDEGDPVEGAAKLVLEGYPYRRRRAAPRSARP